MIVACAGTGGGGTPRRRVSSSEWPHAGAETRAGAGTEACRAQAGAPAAASGAGLGEGRDRSEPSVVALRCIGTAASACMDRCQHGCFKRHASIRNGHGRSFDSVPARPPGATSLDAHASCSHYPSKRASEVCNQLISAYPRWLDVAGEQRICACSLCSPCHRHRHAQH